eukprot:3525543-Pleurochrysis_carterae.AAC.1
MSCVHARARVRGARASALAVRFLDSPHFGFWNRRRFQKYVRIFQYLYVMHPVPPPFNMPIVLYGFFRLLLEQ